MDASVQAFKESAKRYCANIKSLSELPQLEAIQVALNSIAELFYLALLLLDSEPTDIDWPDLVGTKACASLCQRLGGLFGEKDLYWRLFEQTQQPPQEPLAGILSDDLADIWLDVKRGLQTLELNPEASLSDVLWSWKFSFETHWGRHAVSAMATLRSLLYS
jgi:Domain of unknown function (DUF5063)